MRAYFVDEPGGPFRSADVPRLAIGSGQILIRVQASGLNPLDTKIRLGKADHARQPLPAVLGLDMAGVVEEVGADVVNFRPGDEVYGMVGGVGGLQGTLADFIAADETLVAHKPKNLSMREAAVLPLSVITAWEGLIDRAKVRSGQRVLVHAGAGGVGHIAAQLARALGAEVFATVSSDKAEIVKKLGATPIDYRRSSVEEYVVAHTDGQGFDIVYDTVGGATLDASFTAVKRYTGHVVSSLGWGTHALAPLSFRAATFQPDLHLCWRSRSAGISDRRTLAPSSKYPRIRSDRAQGTPRLCSRLPLSTRYSVDLGNRFQQVTMLHARL